MIRKWIPILILAAWVFGLNCGAGEFLQQAASSGLNGNETNSFPDLAQIFQGRAFENEFERDVFFLRTVRDRYPQFWSSLLVTNITVHDYVEAPAKLLRFVDELGTAMRGQNDLTASTNLAAITSREIFYANTNVYHPEILKAAAQALLDLGPTGAKAVASSFTEAHYCLDPESLEELAKVIGQNRPASPDLARALAATAFEFSTTNGGTYPRCTRAAVQNLLSLPEAVPVVQVRLTPERVFDNPGRFQAIMDGIAAAYAIGLRTNLVALETIVGGKLVTLTNSPGAYRDDLKELDIRIKRTVEELQ